MELIRLRTGIFKAHFDLFKGVVSGLTGTKQRLHNEDILVVNSKIVAVSQGRQVHLDTVTPVRAKKSHYGAGSEDPRFVALVQKEADIIAPGTMLLTVKDGIFTPAAGIDRSNAQKGVVTLWPHDSWNVAWQLRRALMKKFHLKKLGVIITDSTCAPLRAGTTGVALAWAGFKGVEDARGKKDIYGNRLTVTRKAVADNLACAAQVLMGEANEQVPLVIVRDAPVVFSAVRPKPTDGSVSMKDCLYGSLYKPLQ